MPFSNFVLVSDFVFRASCLKAARRLSASSLHPAFSLVEVAAVLLLMGLVAAGVTLSAARSRRVGDMADAVGSLAHFDRLTRQRCLRQGRPALIVFDLDAGRIIARPADRGDENGFDGADAFSWTPPAGYAVGDVRLAGGVIRSGRTAIRCSTRGQTPAYAVRIEGSGSRRWILLTGLTGQALEIEDENTIDQLISDGP